MTDHSTSLRYLARSRRVREPAVDLPTEEISVNDFVSQGDAGALD